MVVEIVGTQNNLLLKDQMIMKIGLKLMNKMIVGLLMKEIIFTHFLLKTQMIHSFFKFIRIRQTGPNRTNSNYLFVSSIEFYGFLI